MKKSAKLKLEFKKVKNKKMKLFTSLINKVEMMERKKSKI